MIGQKKGNSASKRKRPCTNCGEKHLPPRGNRCNNVPVGVFDPWDAEDEDGLESAGWATDPYSHGSPSRPTKVDLRPQGPQFKYHPPQMPLFSMHSEWPVPTTGIKKQDVNKPRADDSPAQGGSLPRRVSHGDPVQAQVNDLSRKIDSISATNRDTEGKISNIEHLLSKLVVDHRPDEAVRPRMSSEPFGGARPKVQPAVNQDGGISRSRPRTWEDHNRRPRQASRDSSSSYQSSDSSLCSRRSTSRRKKDSKRRTPSKSKHTFRINRFLPQDERERPMTTDRLWFCHGSLMLELYDYGYDIRGLLQHNVFVAEKAATRAYVSTGIIKYDEAVREKARDLGPSAYSSGDMSLALRFLSTKYARPKTGQNQSNANGGGNQRTSYRRSGNNTNQSPRDRDNRQKVVCWLYNGVGCYIDGCRYPHACSKCNTPGHSQHSCRISNTPSSQLNSASGGV